MGQQLSQSLWVRILPLPFSLHTKSLQHVLECFLFLTVYVYTYIPVYICVYPSIHTLVSASFISFYFIFYCNKETSLHLFSLFVDSVYILIPYSLSSSSLSLCVFILRKLSLIRALSLSFSLVWESQFQFHNWPYSLAQLLFLFQ